MADKIISIPDLIDKNDPGYADYVVQFVIPTDLNHDGIDDFIIQYWRQANPFGSVLTGFTNDKLFALVSNPDGSYRVDNQNVFGTATPKLGGAARKYIAGDINGDGVVDYAFAMNSEDYRSVNDPTNIYALPAVLLSKSGGGYSIVNMGAPSWGHSVALVDNGLGTKDVIFAGYNDNSFQVFRYQSTGFVSVTNQYNANTEGWANAVAGAQAGAGDQASAYVIATHETYDTFASGNRTLTGVGLALFGKVGTNVSIADFSAFHPVGTANLIIQAADAPQPAYIYRFADTDYLNVTFTEVVVDNSRNADGSLTVIGKFEALKVTGQSRLTAGATYSFNNDTVNINVLKVFHLLNGHLAEVSDAIPLQVTEVNLNYYDIIDVNGDGLNDIVAQVFTRPGFHQLADAAGRPAVYINDGQGHYQLVDITGFAGNTNGTPPGPELEGYLKDIDHDGYVDLVTFIVDPSRVKYSSVIQVSYAQAYPGTLGSDSNDRLFGSARDDRIIGYKGNDTINGGAGLDTAIYAATRAQTTVTRNTNGTLTVASTADGTDTVSNVEFFQFADGLYSFRYADPGGTVVNNFAVNAGGWSSEDKFPRHVADVNGDGYADIVGFGAAGTLVSYGSANGAFSAPVTAVANFGQAQGWSSDNAFHRQLIDVNKDGRADIVGFGIGGVLVSLAQADGSFAAPTLGSTNFNQANGWSSEDAFTRTLADVNGDGFADVVGFGVAGTFVALGKGDGTFGTANFALANFGANQGWTSDNTFHRTVADVNGDGRADVIGFGIAGTLVALGQANGTFAAPTLAQANFGTQQGWSTQDAFARAVGDVNGDGKADVVGFGIAGTFVAYGQADGSFSAAAFDVANFGANQGWTSDNILHRELADLNKDGRADIVGFGYNGVFASAAFGG